MNGNDEEKHLQNHFPLDKFMSVLSFFPFFAQFLSHILFAPVLLSFRVWVEATAAVVTMHSKLKMQ